MAFLFFPLFSLLHLRCSHFINAAPMLFHLIKSAERGDLKGLSAFLSERKDSIAIDAFDKFGETALLKGVKKNDIWVVKRLLSAGASVNQGSYSVGRSPLVFACCLGHLDVARVLLQAGADLHLADCNKCVPLHFAAGSNHLEILKLCLESGANPNAQDSVGWTPLMRAVVFDCNEEIINELIANSADVNLKDRNGKTALDLARINKNISLVNILVNFESDNQEKSVAQILPDSITTTNQIHLQESCTENPSFASKSNEIQEI